MQLVRGIVLWLCLSAAVIGGAQAWAEVGAESGSGADAKLRELEQALQNSAARVIEFSEERHFPFRRNPVRLQGIARVWDQAGVSLEYPEKQRLIVVDDAGVLLRKFSDDGSVREKEADTAGSMMAVLLKTLFEFDHEELDRLFTAVWEESPEAGWSILLKAKEGVDLDLQQVVLKGHAAQLEGIEIWFSSKKWIAIHPQSETLCDGFAEDARRKYFREGGKLDE